MIGTIDIEAILHVAELSVMRADEHENCSEMVKRANQFIKSPDAKKAIIFLGALLALDGEEVLPTQAEGQILLVKMMNPQLK
ncbi:MAG: hypothetical protein NTX66_00295 [Candidatus Falkowbacteria bacterium]|nr:hypothetical protein [Candidatus Falkowbacteria bacterium]